MAEYLRFAKFSPAGNTTILIPDSVEPSAYASLAARLMRDLNADQVGYVLPAADPANDARLEMMGGEFCGNASRCLGLYLALGGMHIWDRGQEEDGPGYGLRPEHRTGPYRLEVSGADTVVECRTRGVDPDSMEASVRMPLPKCILHRTHPALGRCSLVAFDGITHLVLWEKAPGSVPEETAIALIEEENCRTEAYGMMFMDGATDRMAPFVCVEQTRSKVWEGSCGSGTVAVGCALADLKGAAVDDLVLRQPGGILKVSIEYRGSRILSAELDGPVTMEAWGYVAR